MKHKAALPEFLLLAQMLLLGMFISRYVPLSVPDTRSYVEFPFNSLSQMLNNYRTPGYPFLLLCVRQLSADYSALPLIQYTLWCLAVWCFWWGTRSLEISRGHRVWVCSALLYANVLHANVRTIATDTVAAATCVAVVGCLIRLETAAKISRWLLTSIGMLCLLACLIRPASLFLILFVPVVGAILTSSRAHTSRLTAGLKRGVLLFCSVSAPIFIYSMLRWIVVGHLGLVSFGGHNLIGIAGQWMDETVIGKLSAETRPFAELARRHQLAWEANHRLHPKSSRMDYSILEERYDPYIWYIFVPAAMEYYEKDPAKMNTGLRQLAQELILARPRNYLIWLAKASRQAIRVVAGDMMANPVMLLYMILGITGELVVLRMSSLHPIGGHFKPDTDDCNTVDYNRLSEILLICAISLLVLSTALIVLVCTPIGRLMDAAAVLLPVVLADQVARKWQGSLLRFSSKGIP